ncbi:hypothetical protein VST7929_03264 [Vibrio stylophorae]|uniref:AEC family transporter n=1 Tax=Vibrio stylophorae TaxID=659351 RepID=A0ABN8DZI9_9VIBR|nr:AEC family transporter [Vibrio stylophorae]CAH0535790.1 hypothetical protein VST7929_03264 [Vibrio stylophorae]
MPNFFSQLNEALIITGPICIMLIAGIILKRQRILDDAFVETASRLLFQFTLPVLLGLSILGTDLHQLNNGPLLAFAIIANTLFFLFWHLLSPLLIQNPSDRGVFVQGTFRGNTGIIGLAYVANLYGQTGLALGALYVAVCTVLFNILATITLSHGQNQSKGIFAFIKNIVKNPLIIGIGVGLVIAWFEWQLPKVLIDTGEYFARMTLPLAVLCTGASIELKTLFRGNWQAWVSAIVRVGVCPLILTLSAYAFGFRKMELTIVFFMSGAPAAAASYVMARAMGGNAKLAAEIIAISTVLSVLTTSLGMMLLAIYA